MKTLRRENIPQWDSTTPRSLPRRSRQSIGQSSLWCARDRIERQKKRFDVVDENWLFWSRFGRQKSFTKKTFKVLYDFACGKSAKVKENLNNRPLTRQVWSDKPSGCYQPCCVNSQAPVWKESFLELLAAWLKFPDREARDRVLNTKFGRRTWRRSCDDLE